MVTSTNNDSQNYSNIDGESLIWTFKYDGGLTYDSYYNDTMSDSGVMRYVKGENNFSI